MTTTVVQQPTETRREPGMSPEARRRMSVAVVGVAAWIIGLIFVAPVLYMLLTSTDIRIASAENARFKFSLLTQGWLGNGPGASMLIKQLRYIDAMKILLTSLRKLVIAIIGGTVLLIGVALIVLPGPAFIVIPIGLAILATEFAWARTMVNRAKAMVAKKSGPS